MKKIIKLSVFIFTLLFVLNTNSQDENYKWQYSFGTNAVDLDADTNTSFTEFFDVKDNWNLSKSPISMLMVSKYIGNNLSFGVGAAFNSISNYATGFELEGTSNDYFSVDAMLKYDLSDLVSLRLLDMDFHPFVGVGPGMTSFAEECYLTGNASLGLNVWLSETFGLTLMSEYKENFSDSTMLDEGGTMRWSLMLTLKFDQDSD
tara:strand:- start:45 stop:656 length:612 start_codon:yes stop_codon:yes gene_type:complete